MKKKELCLHSVCIHGAYIFPHTHLSSLEHGVMKEKYTLENFFHENI